MFVFVSVSPALLSDRKEKESRGVDGDAIHHVLHAQTDVHHLKRLLGTLQRLRLLRRKLLQACIPGVSILSFIEIIFLIFSSAPRANLSLDRVPVVMEGFSFPCNYASASGQT